MRPSESNCVFVLGLPRSGSTLLSRLINTTPDILSVNDLYFLQAAIALGAAERGLTEADMQQLTDELLRVIDTRANANDEFIGQFSISPQQIAEIREAALAQGAAAGWLWHELMNFLLTKVAESTGKSRWADKTPQNFYHFQLIAERFPRARFVFLFRNPYSILASYKFASGEGHDLRRYHPFVYSLYWRSAVRFYNTVKDHPAVSMVRYEDIVDDPDGVCSALGAFLDTQIAVPELTGLGHNSSFARGGRKQISDTERWICDRICAGEMRSIGYTPSPVSRPSVIGLGEVLATSARFSLFQFSRLAGDRNARGRVSAFLRGLSR